MKYSLFESIFVGKIFFGSTMSTMRAGNELHSLEKGAQQDTIVSVRYSIGSAIGGLLCITGVISEEELLAYVGLGKYFILGGMALAYRVGADTSRNELARISVQ